MVAVGTSLYFYVDGSIVSVSAHFEDRDAELSEVIELALKKAPVAFITDLSWYEAGEVSYILAARDEAIELEWVCNVLSHFEEGWEIRDSVLYSPAGSTVKDTQIKELLKSKETGQVIPGPVSF